MEFGIYIHIPFCIQKCRYCDFLSFSGIKEEKREAYVEALKMQIRSYRELFCGHQAATIYFGGGTPSILKKEQIKDILETIRECYKVKSDAEITIECNPKTTTYDKFLYYRNIGVNRLSIGLQSCDNHMLACLGRVHTFEDFLKQYEEAQKAGFTNISIDLMSALPGQSVSDYEKDVKRILALKPAHISSYSLIIEEGTPFSKDKKVLESLPEEEEAVTMYHLTNTWLKQAGYYRYEISNYCRDGLESRHNNSYWIGTAYLGLGLGASSYLVMEQGAEKQYLRFHNETCLDDYIAQNQIVQQPELLRKSWKDPEVLSVADRMEEFMFLGLRRMQGIAMEEFKERFGVPIEEVYAKPISSFIQRGLLRKHNHNGKTYLQLTESGICVSNQVFVEFMF